MNNPKIYLPIFAVAVAIASGCQSGHVVHRACDACWVGDRAPIAGNPAPNADSAASSAGENRPVAGSEAVDQTGSVATAGLETVFPGSDSPQPPEAIHFADANGGLGVVNQPSGFPVGARLSDQQVPASQRALLLKQENQRLKSAGKQLVLQVRKQREILKKREEQLGRMIVAMSAAESELILAERANKQLQAKLSRAESKASEHQIAYERALRLFQSELDDALMDEIALVGE